MSIFPLPKRLVLLMVFIFVPLTKVACLPFKALFRSVWFDNVPVILPQVALSGIVIVTLPLTGGMGSTIFTIAGLALMAIAIITLIKNRKENN